MAKNNREQIGDLVSTDQIDHDPSIPAGEQKLRDDLAKSRDRESLYWDPDPSLRGVSLKAFETISPAAAIAPAVRCLERVLPLIAWHPELAPLAGKAHRTGVALCSGGHHHDAAGVRHDWVELAQVLQRSLDADPIDPDLKAGAAQVALAALSVLEAAATTDVIVRAAECKNAALTAAAAIEAASGEPVRARDGERLTAAVVRDFETLSDHPSFADDAPVDPGESGPFGPLWPDGPPLVLRMGAGATLAATELTPQAGSPKLDPVPTVKSAQQTKETPTTDPLSGLTAPGGSLSPKEALEQLSQLLATVQTEHAPHIEQFRRILKALADHEFEDRAEAVRAVEQLQAVRTLLGVGFVLVNDDAEKNGVRVSLMFDSDPNYPKGRFRAVKSTVPQKKLYARTSLPNLDVTDVTTDS
jgi:hypothetical protein